MADYFKAFQKNYLYFSCLMSSLELKKTIAEKLDTVMDPELDVSIVKLGLLYNIRVEGSTAYITMTLTTIGCPLFGVLEKEIEEKVGSLKEVKNVKLDLVFDPPWNMRMIAPEALAELGIE